MVWLAQTDRYELHQWYGRAGVTGGPNPEVVNFAGGSRKEAQGRHRCPASHDGGELASLHTRNADHVLTVRRIGRSDDAQRRIELPHGVVAAVNL